MSFDSWLFSLCIELFWRFRLVRIIQCCPFLRLCAPMLRWTYWIYLSFPTRWWNWCDINLAAYSLMSVFWPSAPRPCRWRLVTLHELGDRLEASPSLPHNIIFAAVSSSLLNTVVITFVPHPAAAAVAAAADSRIFWELFWELALV